MISFDIIYLFTKIKKYQNTILPFYHFTITNIQIS